MNINEALRVCQTISGADGSVRRPLISPLDAISKANTSCHLCVCRGVWGPHLVVVPTSVMLNWEVRSSTKTLRMQPFFPFLRRLLATVVNQHRPLVPPPSS